MRTIVALALANFLSYALPVAAGCAFVEPAVDFSQIRSKADLDAARDRLQGDIDRRHLEDRTPCSREAMLQYEEDLLRFMDSYQAAGEAHLALRAAAPVQGVYNGVRSSGGATTGTTAAPIQSAPSATVGSAQQS